MAINYLIKHRESARSYQEIVEDFIVRLDLFERAKYELETREKGDSFNNFIYVGNRGSGKSTLLERIRYEIYHDQGLSEKYIPIDFADETRDVYKLYDLWSKIILQLQEQGYTIEEPAFIEYEDRMDEYSRESILRINTLLEKENRILVLFIDNIDRLFKNIKSDKGQLRETLLNYQSFRIFGGSTTMSESFWDYGEAFYEFFSIVQLEDLTKDEIYKLLSHWLKKQGKEELQTVIDENPGKIEAIRIMTGGNPRMMISFMRMLLDSTLETGYDYLRMLIDDATMGYQEKLNHISGQKAKIFSELAYLYEAAQVDQLIQPCKMSSKTISAQLNALIKDNYVEKIKTDNKNHLYRVKERFFNIWMIMTQSSPLVRQKAKYLTDFLELFYSGDDIKTFFLNWKSKLAAGELTADKAIIQAKALYHSKHLDLDEEQEIYDAMMVMEEAQPYGKNIFPKALKVMIREAVELAEAGKKEEAEQLLLQNMPKDERSKYVYNALGYIAHSNAEEAEKAEHYYLAAIEKGLVRSMFNIALLYQEGSSPEKAEEYYLAAIEKGHVKAMYNLAILYQEGGSPEKAEHYYLAAIAKGHVGAMNNLALLYEEGGSPEKAEHYYLAAIEKGHDIAMYNLAILYKEGGSPEKAERYYLAAIEKGDVGAMYNLAILYEEGGSPEKAEEYYLAAIEKGDVGAMYNLAYLYYSNKDKAKEAWQLIQQYIQTEKDDIQGRALHNIIALWSGASHSYLETRDSIISDLLKLNSQDAQAGVLAKYLHEILIHHQENWVLSLFEGAELGAALMQTQLPYYYATLMLKNPSDVKLKAMPPELEETVQELVTRIKEGRKKYYP